MRMVLILLAVLFLLPAPAPADEFYSLCFHDIRRDAGTEDPMVLSTDTFVAMLTWLRENDYHPVSIDDLLAARKGERKLPEKAVLLTFDDGYSHFYTEVFPLLKAFNYPAVLALVGHWMKGAPGSMVEYGDQSVSREDFLSWEQVRKISSSGLVEIASHSYDLHRDVTANPQGNREPALTARRYDSKTSSYETDASVEERIRVDLQANSALIERQTGRRPRVVVWPYGEYNRPALRIAGELGMTIALRLQDGMNRTDNLQEINRYLVEGNSKLPDLVWRLRNPDKQDPHRVVHVDLDYLYDPDPLQAEKNLDRLLDRIKALQINTVYLQAFADPDGDGAADALYFPNRFLPMRADLFNRVSWQLRTRCGVQVYAWLPVLSFVVGREDLRVRTWSAGQEGGELDGNAYPRLSPFSSEARKIIAGIYEDLARQADFHGLLFHDDAVLSDFEDVHPAALAWIREQGMPESLEKIRQDAVLNEHWSELKTRYLIAFTQELADRVRIWRPAIKTARNLFAAPVLDPASQAWFGQDLGAFLQAYDYVAVMAMPYMEKAQNPEKWLRRLVKTVARQPRGLAQTVFELQSVDWRREAPLATETLVSQMQLLQGMGAVNFGYYPDDFSADHPEGDLVYVGISLANYPYGN